MKGTAIRTLGTTVVERAIGGQPGRARAVAAAVVAGATTAAVTYRLLRGGDAEN